MKLHIYALLTTLGLASAHIALWDEAMYGFDPDDVNQSEPVHPLRDLPLTSWFFHGHKNNPPAPGKFMSLPAGGVYHGEVSCNKAFTRYGVTERKQEEIYACPKPDPKVTKTTTGAMHTVDEWDTPVEQLHDVTGCAIAIAYESDASKVKPEDFVVISTNYTCPWFKEVDFEIPDDLPACPEEGCTCMWGWIPSGNGGIKEMYSLNYRCKVEGAKGTRPLPKPPTKCDYPTDKTNCTIGAKQPIYWLQLDHTNVEFDSTCTPFYNGTYGYMNGAQTDLFAGIADDDASDTEDLDKTYRLSGLGVASQPPASSLSTSAHGSHQTPHSSADDKASPESQPKGSKGKSGKVCKRGRHTARNRRSNQLSQQVKRSHIRSLEDVRQESRSMTRRMGVVAGQARMNGVARRRDSTAV